MRFNYKTLLLILSILLPLTMVEAVQPQVSQIDVSQRETKHKKSTWRRKIYTWVGIATGVAAGVALAAGIYFKVQQPTFKSTSELLKKIEEAKDLTVLDQLHKQAEKTSYLNDEAESSYMRIRAELEKEVNSKIIIKNKEQLLDALKMTKTMDGYRALINHVKNAVGKPGGFDTQAQFNEVMKDPDVITTERAQYFLVNTINVVREARRNGELRNTNGELQNSVAEQLKDIIEDDLKAYYHLKYINLYYDQLKLIDDAEFKKILESEPVQKVFIEQKKKAENYEASLKHRQEKSTK